MKAVLSESERQSAIDKADDIRKTSFNAEVSRGVSMVYKVDDDYYIWGPASVEVVDKEDDKIRVEALEKALPQLLKRARLSYAHTDQIVGKILDSFETSEPVEVQIGDDTYERSTFPTEVLDLEGKDAAMYVAGEVYDDTEKAVDVRQKIEDGEIDSYSISGEALVTRKQVEGDMVYDDILELDLSAVTLCEEGMNQEAKFARINGEVEDVEPAEVDKSFEVTNGSVRSPDEIVAKSADSEPEQNMTEQQEETPDESFEEKFAKHFDVHFTRKSDDLTDLVVDAVMDEVNKEQNELIDVLVDEVSKEMDNAIDKRIEEVFPDEPVATKGYVDALVEDLQEKEGEDYEEDEEMEDEEMEDEEDEEETDVDVDEAENVEIQEGDETASFTEDELKDALPSDVYEVVSEYVGTSKEDVEADDSESEEAEKSVAEQQQDALSKHVEEVLAGDAPSSPSVGMEDREEEFEELNKEDEDEEGLSGGSPALQNFDHAQ